MAYEDYLSYEGGYVVNERNQLQETPGVLSNSSGCRTFLGGILQDYKKSSLAKSCRAEANISDCRSCR